jgi:hypothetical protein
MTNYFFNKRRRVPVDSKIFLITKFINLKIKQANVSAATLRGTPGTGTCTRVARERNVILFSHGVPAQVGKLFRVGTGPLYPSFPPPPTPPHAIAVATPPISRLSSTLLAAAAATSASSALRQASPTQVSLSLPPRMFGGHGVGWWGVAVQLIYWCLLCRAGSVGVKGCKGRFCWLCMPSILCNKGTGCITVDLLVILWRGARVYKWNDGFLLLRMEMRDLSVQSHLLLVTRKLSLFFSLVLHSPAVQVNGRA